MNLMKIVWISMLVGLCLGTGWFQLNKAKMNEINQARNSQYHHGVLFNSSFRKPYEKIFFKEFVPSLILYENDCSSNPLPECDRDQQYQAVLIFNKQMLRYPGTPKSLEQIHSWFQKIEQTKAFSNITTKQQLSSLLSEKKQIFVMRASSQKNNYQKLLMNTLAKQFYFLTFVYLRANQLGEELQLEKGKLVHIMQDITKRFLLNSSASYSAVQQLVRERFIPFLPRVNNLLNKRFTHQEIAIDTYALVCDFTFECMKIWDKVSKMEKQIAQTGVQFRKMITGDKNTEFFQIYFHLQGHLNSLPALINIKQTNTNDSCGMPTRYIRHFDQQQLNIQTINRFISDVTNKKIDEIILNSGIPQNNGYYGKGASRYIQKLSYQTIDQAIRMSSEHYVLLVTMNSQFCSACKQVYETYKKTVSYFMAEEMGIKFGMIDLMENQINIGSLERIPSLLLYSSEDKGKPIILSHSSFEGFRASLEKELKRIAEKTISENDL